MFRLEFLCHFYSKNIQRGNCAFSGGHFGCDLKYIYLTLNSLQKYISFTNFICLYDLIKMQTNIQIQISVFKSTVDTLYLADILDAILNFLQGPMISRVHYNNFDSIMTVSNAEEAQIFIQYKYMVKHIKSLKTIILAAMLDAILFFFFFFLTEKHELKTIELIPTKVVRKHRIFIHFIIFMDKLYSRTYVFSLFSTSWTPS